MRRTNASNSLRIKLTITTILLLTFPTILTVDDNSHPSYTSVISSPITKTTRNIKIVLQLWIYLSTRVRKMAATLAQCCSRCWWMKNRGHGENTAADVIVHVLIFGGTVIDGYQRFRSMRLSGFVALCSLHNYDPRLQTFFRVITSSRSLCSFYECRKVRYASFRGLLGPRFPIIGPRFFRIR